MNIDRIVNIAKIAGVAGLFLVLAGCGNGWEISKKELKSNYSDLLRRVKVYDSFTKETLWEFEGVVYMSEKSVPGNVTFVYRDSQGRLMKNDFVGQHIQTAMFEIP